LKSFFEIIPKNALIFQRKVLIIFLGNLFFMRVFIGAKLGRQIKKIAYDKI